MRESIRIMLDDGARPAQTVLDALADPGTLTDDGTETETGITPSNLRGEDTKELSH
jgi:hypothetical protein